MEWFPACFIDWIPAYAGMTGQVASEGQDRRRHLSGDSQAFDFLLNLLGQLAFRHFQVVIHL
jgi:hypothetical protein